MLRFWPESGYFMEIRICDLLPVSSPPQPHTDRQGSAGPTAPRPPTHRLSLSGGHLVGDAEEQRLQFPSPYGGGAGTTPGIPPSGLSVLQTL